MQDVDAEVQRVKQKSKDLSYGLQKLQEVWQPVMRLFEDAKSFMKDSLWGSDPTAPTVPSNLNFFQNLHRKIGWL